jgi:hypothetical protein
VSKRAERAAGDLGGAALVSARLQAQAADGVAAPLRKALPAAEAAALSGQWKAADAQQRLALFSQWQQGYGAQAGRVMGEIGLSPLEQQSARRALAEGTPEAARDFLTVSAAASADDKQLPDVDRFGPLKREVAAGSKSMQAMYDMAERVMPGNSAFAGTIKAAEDTAGRLLKMQGGNVERTVSLLDAGLGRLDGDRYALVYVKGNTDGDMLEDALGHAADLLLKDFREALPGYAQGVPAGERAAYLQRKGIWANAPDGDGWVLFDPRAQAPIINERGEFFRVRPGEVAGLASGRERGVAGDTAVWGY